MDGIPARTHWDLVIEVFHSVSAALSQSGLDKEWWADSMECYCYL